MGSIKAPHSKPAIFFIEDRWKEDNFKALTRKKIIIFL